MLSRIECVHRFCTERLMDRYMTRRYVATCWADALRLAQLDSTALEDIKHSQDVELRHRTDWWALWSDNRLTTAIGLPEALHPNGLSADAISLIEEVWIGGDFTPQCGWALLARVDRILDCERVYFFEERDFVLCQENLTLRFVDHEVGRLLRCSAKIDNCYQCDLIAPAAD